MPPRNANDDRNQASTAPSRFSTQSLLRTMAILAFLYVCLLAYLHFQSKAEIRQFFGGAQGIAALNHADQIEAYRVDGSPLRNSSSNALEDFPIIKGPVAISQSDADALVAVLEDRNSYLWEVRKACIFVPGVRFDFIHGDDRLSVLVCFQCDMVVNYLNGKIVGGGNTDKVRQTLVRIAHSIFPDDPKIQSITEQNSPTSPQK